MGILEGKIKPGGLEGREEFFVTDIDGLQYVVTAQNIAGLATSYADILEIPTTETNTALVLNPNGTGGVEWGTDAGFVLTDGHATTANGTAVDLGGTSIFDVEINMDGNSRTFDIIDGTNGEDDSHRFRIWNTNHNMEFNTRNSNADYGYFNIQPNGFDVGSYDDATGLGAYIDLSRSRQIFRMYNATDTMDFRVNPDGILMTNLKSGATAIAAGASTNELWITSSHATLPDNVVMIG